MMMPVLLIPPSEVKLPAPAKLTRPALVELPKMPSVPPAPMLVVPLELKLPVKLDAPDPRLAVEPAVLVHSDVATFDPVTPTVPFRKPWLRSVKLPPFRLPITALGPVIVPALLIDAVPEPVATSWTAVMLPVIRPLF